MSWCSSFQRLRITTALAAVGVYALLSSPVSALTLPEAVSASLQDNPDVQIVVKEKLARESRVEEARSGFLPKVDFTALGGQQYRESEITRVTSTTGLDDDDKLDPLGASLSLRQMIFDGFDTANHVDEKMAGSQAATYRLRAQAEQVALDVIRTYLDVIRNSRIAQLGRANVKSRLEYLEMVRKVHGNTHPDVAQAVSSLGMAQNQLTEALNQLRASVAAYNRLVGEEPDKLMRPEAPLAHLPATLQLAIEKAKANHPSVLAAEQDFKSAFYGAESTKSAFLPRFDVELDATRGRDIADIRDDDTNVQALVVMRYNLYNGGADTARQRTALFERSRSQSVMEKVGRLVEEETKLAWNAMLASKESIETSRDVVKSAVQVRDSIFNNYQSGKRSLMDFMTAEDNLFSSRADLINARFDMLYHTYRILTATGELLETLQVPMPEHFADVAMNQM